MQIGKISAYDLDKVFTGFYHEMTDHRWDLVTRIMHNEEQIIRCQLRDDSASPNATIKYWNMDGTEAAQFTVGSGGVPYTNILDMTWINDEQKFVYIQQQADHYKIYKCLPDGAVPELLVDNFIPAEFAAWDTSASGSYVAITSSNDDTFVKVEGTVYKMPHSVTDGGPHDWSSIAATCYSGTGLFHYGDGSYCDNLAYQPVESIDGYLLYTWYDSNIDVLYLRSITVSGNTMGYATTHWAMLNLDDYSDFTYKMFINQLDPDSWHLLTGTSVSGNQVADDQARLEVFNIDEELAAFLNVNSSDTVMPAGIGATSAIIATVANCWGTTLSGKLVQFWVSTGDGGVYPSYDYTDVNGRAETEFTTGAVAGVSNVSVVVNEV